MITSRKNEMILPLVTRDNGQEHGSAASRRQKIIAAGNSETYAARTVTFWSVLIGL